MDFELLVIIYCYCLFFLIMDYGLLIIAYRLMIMDYGLYIFLIDYGLMIIDY